MTRYTSQRGVTLLITMLITSVLVGISASLLNVTLKQYRLSGIARDSEMAFQAANAGMECVVYHDTLPSGVSVFDVPSDGTSRAPIASLSCMEVTSGDLVNDPVSGEVHNGEEQRFQFSWGTPEVCSDVSIYKFSSDSASVDMSVVLNQSPGTTFCSEDTVCSVVRSRGYSASCASVASTRTLERELIQRY